MTLISPYPSSHEDASGDIELNYSKTRALRMCVGGDNLALSLLRTTLKPNWSRISHNARLQENQDSGARLADPWPSNIRFDESREAPWKHIIQVCIPLNCRSRNSLSKNLIWCFPTYFSSLCPVGKSGQASRFCSIIASAQSVSVHCYSLPLRFTAGGYTQLYANQREPKVQAL